jgi:hypothetical protein
MVTKGDIENLCSINQDFISKLFDDFFYERKIKIESLINFSCDEYYNNCDIRKIEIKKGKTYEGFINLALGKIVNYYLD